VFVLPCRQKGGGLGAAAITEEDVLGFQVAGGAPVRDPEGMKPPAPPPGPPQGHGAATVM